MRVGFSHVLSPFNSGPCKNQLVCRLISSLSRHTVQLCLGYLTTHSIHSKQQDMSHSAGIRRPVQIEEFIVSIQETPSNELGQIRSEINNAVRHLERSNRRLAAYVAKLKGEEIQNRSSLDADGDFSEDEIDESDLQVFQESLVENEKVLDNYEQRLQALDLEEQHRSGAAYRGPDPQARTPRPKQTTVDSDNTATDPTAPNTIYL